MKSFASAKSVPAGSKAPASSAGLAGGIRQWAGRLFGHSATPAAESQRNVPMARPAAPVHNETPAAMPAVVAQDGLLTLPLARLLPAFPAEVQKLAVSRQLSVATVTFPVERIASQLSRGVVRITFGEIRRAAPGVFIDDFEQDHVEVALPLSELVMRLGPAILQRRPQRKVAIPTEVSSPFEEQAGWSADLTNAPEPAAPVAPTPMPAPEPARVVEPVVAEEKPTPIQMPMFTGLNPETTPMPFAAPVEVPATGLVRQLANDQQCAEVSPLLGERTQVRADVTLTSGDCDTREGEQVRPGTAPAMVPVISPEPGLTLVAPRVVEPEIASVREEFAAVSPEIPATESVPPPSHDRQCVEAFPLPSERTKVGEDVIPTPAEITAPLTQTDGLVVSLAAMINALPADLRALAVPGKWEDAMVALPQEKILAQLSRGAVYLTFGEIRRRAPGAFNADPEQDAVMVSLPLQELVMRLAPAALQRRSQKKLELSPEVISPFEAAVPAPAEVPVAPDTHAPVAETAAEVTIAPPEPAVEVAKVEAAAPGTLTVAVAVESEVARANVEAPTVAEPEAPVVAEPVVAAAVLAPAVEVVIVPLANLVASWPAALKDFATHGVMADAKVALPKPEIEPGLKTGKLEFRWETVRHWISPAPGPAAAENDSLMVNLPLSAVAMAFLLHRRSGAAAEATPASRLKVEAPRLDTPEAVVRAAVRLAGVNGALVSLPDGLPVASELDDSINGESLAALLPQAYGTMRSWTKELRFGELSELSFTAGNRTWKILRTNGLYFAVYGRAGANLPGAELAQLAGRLNHWEGN